MNYNELATKPLIYKLENILSNGFYIRPFAAMQNIVRKEINETAKNTLAKKQYLVAFLMLDFAKIECKP